jgi:hypothetical protein
VSIQVIEGRKDEIVEKIAKLHGQVTRAIIWVDEPVPRPRSSTEVDAILAQLNEDTVSVGRVDDSREAIYTRLEDE